jgi:DNA-binding CsgD family transcriptional regulator
MATPPSQSLLGRADERKALETCLDNVRGGQSAVLVLRGEAGVGKTALVRHCARHASGFDVARVAGVEVEMELPFAGIHQLCAPFLDRVDALPAPQREALRTALGLAPGDAPNRFLIALAVLGLLCHAAQDRPLLCLVDDAQWLDDASSKVLGFVARRLLAESVALVFAVREPANKPELEGLPALALSGLDEADARALLARAIPGRLDDRVRDRLLTETQGNPLAILELPRGMSAAQLAGGFDVPATSNLPQEIERRYVERVRALPSDSQRLLLLAAAERLGDSALLWRAAKRLGIGASALASAQDDALVDFGALVRFRHPLVRSAAYRVAPAEARRDVHRALAEACDPEADADRRAWHLALATPAPDEDVASELERAAGRAQTRGGLAAAAAFLERATALTPSPERRAERLLAAAELKLMSGAATTAARLLGDAETGPLDAIQRARAHLIRGRAAVGSKDGREAPALLLAAARELEPLDRVSARDTLLDALSAGLFVGRLAGDVGVREVARAAAATPSTSERPQDLLLDGLSSVITDGHRAGAPLLKRAISAFRAGNLPAGEDIRWLWLAAHAAHDLWDDEAWAELCDRHIALARDGGALSILPIAISTRIGLHLFAGELTTAASLVEETVAVTDAIGSGLPLYGALALAAFRGDEEHALGLIEAVRAQVGPRGEGMGLTLVEHAEAVLFNGLGRYAEACAAARRGAAFPHELGGSTWSLAQLVEAATRSDQPAVAEDAFERLRRSTSHSGTAWALGVEARSRALVSHGEEAERAYREAIDQLAATKVRGEHARAHLLFGEWLRRQGRRVAAREQLRTAHRMLAGMGMQAFAERARRELIATGERVRARGAEARDELTPQELQVAQLAREGLSNPEIAARLFLSPRTVEWHMKKVFAKLGIKSRMALHEALPDHTERPAAPA